MKKNKNITSEYKKKVKKLFIQGPNKVLTIKAISKRIKYKGPSAMVYRIVKQLERDKFLVEVSRGKYGRATSRRSKHRSTASASGSMIGRMDKTRSGAGYVIVDGMEHDVYVPAKHLKGAMRNDIVEVEITRIKRNGKPEGYVRKIIERSIQDVIAKLYNITNRGYAYPIQEIGIKEIDIPTSDLNGAVEGDTVLLEIKYWPEKPNQSPIAAVTEVLTNYENHELSELSILTKYGFNYIFPSSISDELKQIEQQGINWNPEKREDYRDVLTYTIDPADAKDFDDALSYDEFGNGDVEVGIHIADVTHYLEKNTLLDKEARRRSTSVYLVGKVCPMLPETLSNDLCSLVEQKDRLTFAVTFRVTPENKITDYWIGKTIIRSDKRFAYEEAQEILDGKRSKFKKSLTRIKEFADSQRQARNNDGAINFDSQEIRFLLDEKKYPTDIYIKERKSTHLMVEDLMLLANKTIAHFIDKKSHGRTPLPYRVHDEPDMDKIADLAAMAKMLGFEFNYSNMNAVRASFNRLHESARKNETFHILEQLGIRSMAKAIYTTDNIGHFGLAFSHYAHFTSPIRRYADVLVHRIVYAFLQKEELHYDKSKLEAMCSHISRRERLAMEAERESIKLKQAEFMKQFEGQSFNGKISGLIDRGMFVNLEKGIGEGLVPFQLFDEAFELHRSGFSAIGQATGTIYAMGDNVRVRIVEVDVEGRRIEMEMVEEVSR